MHNDFYRRSVRLPTFDYTDPGPYFVTICTYKRAHSPGWVRKGTVVLSEAGTIVREAWLALPIHFPGVDLDEYVVMPNHIHALLEISSAPRSRGSVVNVPPPVVGATHASPLRAITDTARSVEAQRPRPAGPVCGSLGAIIGSFKSAATRRVNMANGTPGLRVWQRDYYERVVRDSASLAALRAYIRGNPERWESDDL